MSKLTATALLASVLLLTGCEPSANKKEPHKNIYDMTCEEHRRHVIDTATYPTTITEALKVNCKEGQ